MKIRNLLPVILLFTLSLIMVGMMGCADKTEPAPVDDDNSDLGRIIVPDIERSDDSIDDTEPVNDEPDDDESVEGGAVDGDGGGGTPDEVFYEAGTITIDLYMNDVLQNPLFPIEVYNLNLTKVEFRITAEGPPLRAYNIENAGPVNLPWRDDLEGQSAVVEYEFTYNDGYWEDWGIIIFVSNEQGDSISKNYKVVPIEVPGFPTGR